MSKAFQCDRCGKCFNPADMKSSDEFASIPEITTQSTGDYLLNQTTFRMDGVNLCPVCTKEYITWMSKYYDIR